MFCNITALTIRHSIYLLYNLLLLYFEYHSRNPINVTLPCYTVSDSTIITFISIIDYLAKKVIYKRLQSINLL
jgi:hypothetical protein